LMFHILLDITEDQMVLFREKPCSYIRILGFRKDTPAIAMLKQYAQTQQIPVILSVAEASRQLENNVFFHQDLFTRELYIKTLTQKDYHNRKTACDPLLSDYRQPLIVV
ncbi:MAG: nucleotidyltransferase family protein, partial [Lachnospiraceae bacterium]